MAQVSSSEMLSFRIRRLHVPINKVIVTCFLSYEQPLSPRTLPFFLAITMSTSSHSNLKAPLLLKPVIYTPNPTIYTQPPSSLQSIFNNFSSYDPLESRLTFNSHHLPQQRDVSFHQSCNDRHLEQRIPERVPYSGQVRHEASPVRGKWRWPATNSSACGGKKIIRLEGA